MHFCVLLSSLYSLLSWRVNTRARSLCVCVSSVGAFARISKRYYSSFSLPSVYDIVVERPPLLKLFNAAASSSCTARLLSVFPLSSTLWIFSLLLLTVRELAFFASHVDADDTSDLCDQPAVTASLALSFLLSSHSFSV